MRSNVYTYILLFLFFNDFGECYSSIVVVKEEGVGSSLYGQGVPLSRVLPDRKRKFLSKKTRKQKNKIASIVLCVCVCVCVQSINKTFICVCCVRLFFHFLALFSQRQVDAHQCPISNSYTNNRSVIVVPVAFSLSKNFVKQSMYI